MMNQLFQKLKVLDYIVTILAKLNGLYGQSRKLQKMVLKKKENPSRII